VAKDLILAVFTTDAAVAATQAVEMQNNEDNTEATVIV